jgi:DNA-directed RNA polymerase specialized sigma24 family protein
MSRNFTPDQTLIDQLVLNDTAAFEELYHRHCYSLYTYCNDKLNSPADARAIVRDVFITLWEKRQTLPVGFSVSLYLYQEIRKAVVACINQKLEEDKDLFTIQTQIIPGFAVINLQEAKKPIRKSSSEIRYINSLTPKRETKDYWWNHNPSGITVRDIKQMLQKAFNLL